MLTDTTLRDMRDRGELVRLESEELLGPDVTELRTEEAVKRIGQHFVAVLRLKDEG